MTATLLHIGGGALQISSIKWAQDAGLDVAVTDLSPNPPGREVADYFFQVGADDVAGLVSLATDIDYTTGLAGVFCSSDLGLPAVAAIGVATGVPAVSPESLAVALDKNAATERWRKSGVPTTRGIVTSSHAELNSTAEQWGFPLIVKPADSSGSRGVKSVWNERELVPSFDAAQKFSDQVIAEQYIEGDHFDVNGFFANNIFHPGGILNRYFSEPPFHVPLWGCQPPSLDSGRTEQIYRLTEDAARALGINTGPVKADIVWEKSADAPTIIELAPRFHGDVSTAQTTPIATGSSPIRAWFEFLADSAATVRNTACPSGVHGGWMSIMADHPGTFGSLSGLDAALAQDGIRDIAVIKKAGCIIENSADTRSILGFIWATGDSPQAVHTRLLHARQHLTVEML